MLLALSVHATAFVETAQRAHHSPPTSIKHPCFPTPACRSFMPRPRPWLMRLLTSCALPTKLPLTLRRGSGSLMRQQNWACFLTRVSWLSPAAGRWWSHTHYSCACSSKSSWVRSGRFAGLRLCTSARACVPQRVFALLRTHGCVVVEPRTSSGICKRMHFVCAVCECVCVQCVCGVCECVCVCAVCVRVCVCCVCVSSM